MSHQKSSWRSGWRTIQSVHVFSNDLFNAQTPQTEKLNLQACLIRIRSTVDTALGPFKDECVNTLIMPQAGTKAGR
jgi:hypothetical protein